MRICFVIYSLGSGGAERVASTLANYWVKKGWLTTLITLTSSEDDFYQLDQGIKRIALNLSTPSANVFQAIYNNLKRLQALRRALQSEKPDIVLSFMDTANVLTGLACYGTHLKVVGSERIHPPALPLNKRWRVLRRMVYPRLAAVVALTHRSAEWLQRFTGARWVPVIPNPVLYPIQEQEPRVDPKQVLTRLAGQHVLLAVGRLVTQKGFDRLLDAFSLLHQRHPLWRLVILGEGPLRNALSVQLKQLGLEDCVALPGAVGNIGEWYLHADLYCLSSRFEGFPNTLVEALSYGLPSVAVDCETGPREILRHEVDGLLVPPDDSIALAQALDRLMGDAKLRSQFAKRAVEARTRFSIETVAGLWEKIFMKIIHDDR